MNTADYMILAIVALALFLAIRHIQKTRRAGNRCVGCPDSAICTRNSPGAFERERNAESAMKSTGPRPGSEAGECSGSCYER